LKRRQPEGSYFYFFPDAKRAYKTLEKVNEENTVERGKNTAERRK